MASVDEKRVWEALCPRLGADLAQAVCAPVARALRAYTPREALEETAQRAEDALFGALYQVLGVAMRYRLPDGRVRVIRLEELSSLADDALLALLETLRPSPANYDLLKRYAMASGSLSALRMLCGPYATYQSAEEVAVARRVLQGRDGEQG